MEDKYCTAIKNKNGYDIYNVTCVYTNGLVLNTTKTKLLHAQNHVGSYSVPNGIEIILDNAFEGCEYITEIKFPNTVKAIGNYAFKDCI